MILNQLLTITFTFSNLKTSMSPKILQTLMFLFHFNDIEHRVQPTTYSKRCTTSLYPHRIDGLQFYSYDGGRGMPPIILLIFVTPSVHVPVHTDREFQSLHLQHNSSRYQIQTVLFARKLTSVFITRQIVDTGTVLHVSKLYYTANTLAKITWCKCCKCN